MHRLNTVHMQIVVKTKAALMAGLKYFLHKRFHLPLQLIPSPKKPALQMHLNEPAVLLHQAFSEHLCVPAVHSSISEEHA